MICCPDKNSARTALRPEKQTEDNADDRPSCRANLVAPPGFSKDQCGRCGYRLRDALGCGRCGGTALGVRRLEIRPAPVWYDLQPRRHGMHVRQPDPPRPP